MLKRIIACALFLFLSSLAWWLARAYSRPIATAFVIRNVRVFDGERTIPKSDVVVIDGKIAAIGPGASVPPGAEVIDGSGDTLLPGLIDSHVHIWIRPVLERSLAFGVTTVLDMFMRVGDACAFRKEQAAGASDIADFRTAETCVTSPGGLTAPDRPSASSGQQFAQHWSPRVLRALQSPLTCSRRGGLGRAA